MKHIHLFIFALLVVLSGSCSDSPEVDQEKPNIDNSFTGAFPINCDTIYFGETFDLNLLFTDNYELGSYSINIHDNFDHHSHSTEISACPDDPDKTAINPYSLITDFDIPEGQQSYQTSTSISIPSVNNNGLFDEGDYHFFISLTDKEGWSSQKGISIKMLYR